MNLPKSMEEKALWARNKIIEAIGNSEGIGIDHEGDIWVLRDNYQ